MTGDPTLTWENWPLDPHEVILQIRGGERGTDRQASGASLRGPPCDGRAGWRGSGPPRLRPALHVWTRSVVGGELCFMGQNVSWPGWLQGRFLYFLVSYLSIPFSFSFLNYFVLWYFSSLGMIFNSKTGLTAVAFLFHLFLSEALKYLLKSAISGFSSFVLT